jgi:hypothetical protein
MPNGGSDCCGTCWFNARNKGEVGYRHADDPEPPFCQIRGLAIEDPFYTYCANHPSKTHGRRIPVPVGPVFVADVLVAHGVSYERRLWAPSPDTPDVRATLLEHLAAIEEEPTATYPSGEAFDNAVIWQLGEFREARALRGLERVRLFDPTLGSGDFMRRPQAWTVALAEEALGKILPAGSADPAWLTGNGGAAGRLARAIADGRRFADLPVLADALEEAGCTDPRVLFHCREGGPHAARCWILEVLLGPPRPADPGYRTNDSSGTAG